MILSEMAYATLEALQAGSSIRDIKDATADELHPHLDDELPGLSSLLHEFNAPRRDQVSVEIASRLQDTLPQCAHRQPNKMTIFCGSGHVSICWNDLHDPSILQSLRDYYDVSHDIDAHSTIGHLCITRNNDGSYSVVASPDVSDLHSSQENTAACFVEVSRAITELACNYPAHMAVLHAATLVRDDQVLILINPSGSGKTTLAWLLTTIGYALVHDDCLPVRPNGDLVQVLTPSILKEGSWNVLEQSGLQIQNDEFTRLGRQVRYQAITRLKEWPAGKGRRFLFVHYVPNATSSLTPVSPLETFRRIVCEEAVIPRHRPERLAGLFDWITSTDSAELRYSDFRDAARLIDDWISHGKD